MLLIIGQTARDGLFWLQKWHMWDRKREKDWKSLMATQQNNLFYSSALVRHGVVEPEGYPSMPHKTSR